jgi:FkbM family methyltransferase
MNLHKIRECLNNHRIENILDVGANTGEFSLSINSIFPLAKIFMVEANYNCEKYLKALPQFNYTIQLLSNEIKQVDFYLNNKNLISTGSSYYLEDTEHFRPENLVIEKRLTSTLDSVFPDAKFDFIKLDTQGSELDIIAGGEKCIKNCKAILIECSTKNYNIGSPLMDETIKKLYSLGFTNSENISELNHVGQLDILFWK